jgi:membrane-bound lytic murein transglycosylase D
MKFCFPAFLILLFLSSSFGAEEREFPDPKNFPLPPAYRENVEFWMRVYGEWKDNQMVIHDSQKMDIVYEVMDIPEENNLLRTAAKLNVSKRMLQIQNILLDLNQNPDSHLTSEEHKKIHDLFENDNEPNKFRNAAINIRVQQGIKDRFESGLERMTQYVEQIKRIFREEGMPGEIAYLPLVESSFNNQSLSKTRAAGIWQFMPGTARFFMKVNSDVDERLDPYVATRAAARYLKKSYQLFGNWPMALMSYNHGQQGIQNAVARIGSRDFMTILDNYEGKYFGFASRNFYAEFLAACKVMNNSEKYFGRVNYAKPLLHDSIQLAKPLYTSSLLNQADLTREELRTYNPALQPAVIFSRRPIPAGYVLRIPRGRVSDLPVFIARLRNQAKPSKTPTVAATEEATSNPKSSKSSSYNHKKYVVRRGDTLFTIAQKFSIPIDSIRKLNGLNHNRILPGQVLLVGSP